MHNCILRIFAISTPPRYQSHSQDILHPITSCLLHNDISYRRPLELHFFAEPPIQTVVFYLCCHLVFKMNTKLHILSFITDR